MGGKKSKPQEAEKWVAVAPPSHGFSVGQRVSCPYGDGSIISMSSRTRIEVRLESWELAYGSKVTCFVAAEQLSPYGLKVGATVSCYAGTGVVLEMASKSRVKVQLGSWELAYGSKVTCYLAEKQLKVVVPAIPAPLAPGTRVDTQYGKGAVVEARATDYVVELDPACWELAYECRPKLFLAPSQVKVETGESAKEPVGGMKVDTPFGDGYVLSTRGDGQKVVESGKWQLAYSCAPRMFLDAKLVTKVM